MNSHPPRLAEWVLVRLLDDESRESVAGDLAEEYRRLVRRAGRGAASRWYWRAVGRSIIACRVTGYLLANSMARPRLVMLALSLFGIVALVLCISGLYAVIVLSSQQRRREYAIRVALGARRGVVRRMVIRQALIMAGAGAAVGLAVAALGTRALQGLLHGVQPLDATTFTIAAITLLTLAVLAAWYPASQAERVNRVETLRAE
jgi:putative ABC transport system permease protein